MRALAILTVVLLLTPTVQAATPLALQVLDDQVGRTHQGLEEANRTHGDREAFQAARVELGRAGTALTQGALVVSQTSLLRAQGALETGRTEARSHQAEDPDQAFADHAELLAGRADANISDLRANLFETPAAGLEPVALDGLLATSYLVIQAMDFLDQHRIHRKTWDDGHHDEEVARGLMGTAAAAETLSRLAQDLQSRIAAARADAPVQTVATPETLAQISQDRVDWLQAQGTSMAQDNQDRVVRFHQADEHLLALAAFNLWYQDLTFNGISTEAQRGQDIEPLEVARDLLSDAGPAVDAWHEELGTASGSAQGTLASAQFTLDRSTGTTGRQANQSGAYAASLVHRAVEHTGVLQDAFSGQAHIPGEPLAMPGSQDQDQERSIPGLPSLVVGTLLAALAAAGGSGRRRQG